MLLSCKKEGDIEGLKQAELLNQLGLTRIEISPRDMVSVDSDWKEILGTIVFPVSDTEQLIATGYNDEGGEFPITTDVTWGVVDTTSGSVNADGVMTTTATAGTVEVTANISSLSITQTVTVSSAPTTAALEVKIRDDFLNTNVDVCKNVQLDAFAVYGTERRRVTHKANWTRTAGLAAEVNVSDAAGTKGLLGTSVDTASAAASNVAYGITATYTGSTPGTISITADATLDSISITPDSGTVDVLPVNDTQQFSASGTYGSETVDISSNTNWGSTATNVATIDADGLMTGVTAGLTTNVTAGCGTITATPVEVTIDGSSILQTVQIDKTYSGQYLSLDTSTNTTADLTATAFYTNGTSADITADDSTSWTVVTIPGEVDGIITMGTTKGRVNASTAGTAIVELTHNNKSDTVTVVVTP